MTNASHTVRPRYFPSVAQSALFLALGLSHCVAPPPPGPDAGNGSDVQQAPDTQTTRSDVQQNTDAQTVSDDVQVSTDVQNTADDVQATGRDASLDGTNTSRSDGGSIARDVQDGGRTVTLLDGGTATFGDGGMVEERILNIDGMVYSCIPTPPVERTSVPDGMTVVSYEGQSFDCWPISTARVNCTCQGLGAPVTVSCPGATCAGCCAKHSYNDPASSM